jgi:hypothetical protein
MVYADERRAIAVSAAIGRAKSHHGGVEENGPKINIEKHVPGSPIGVHI